MKILRGVAATPIAHQAAASRENKAGHTARAESAPVDGALPRLRV